MIKKGGATPMRSTKIWALLTLVEDNELANVVKRLQLYQSRGPSDQWPEYQNEITIFIILIHLTRKVK